jgi:hypothetical protein
MKKLLLLIAVLTVAFCTNARQLDPTEGHV